MAAKSLDPETIKGKLLQGSFMNNGPVVSQLTDPIADTPMVITLDRLRPYEHNPRLNRNPLFDDLKASIRNRGLEAPPPITRRPGEAHYIIRNGGNTRLAILNELWTETRDEQFFRINCLFRPWPERGDIVALTGHLAENDMHGELTFIERALGIEQSKEFYQLETGEPVSQRELARLLAADGYSVSQSQISRMQDTVQHLLPAIPTVLYAGLGKPQIERLIALRRSAERTWQQQAPRDGIDFGGLFVEVLATFDDKPDFTFERFQDELIHHMQQPLDRDYNWLKLDILEGRAAQTRPTAPNVLPQTPQISSAPAAELLAETAASETAPETEHQYRPPSFPNSEGPRTETVPESSAAYMHAPDPLSDAQKQELIQAHIITPIPGMTPRIQAMKRQLAEATGEPIPDFDAACLQAIPVQVGGLHPVSDLWYIERQIDDPAELRQQIFGLVSDVANEVQTSVILSRSECGLGFVLGPQSGAAAPLTPMAAAAMRLIQSLDGQKHDELSFDLGQLLLGCPRHQSRAASADDRLSDQALVKIFRVVRLARRLIELEAST